HRSWLDAAGSTDRQRGALFNIDDFSSTQALIQRPRIGRPAADNFRLWRKPLEMRANAANQSPASHSNQHCIEFGLASKKLNRDRSLPGHDLHIVVGRNV